MQQHLTYLENEIRALEQKRELRGIDTTRECELLRDLVKLAQREHNRMDQVRVQWSLKCHMAGLSNDLLDHMMRRFLVDSEILTLTLCNKYLHKHFYSLYLEMVAPRRQHEPVRVTGTHTRHFWYTIPRLTQRPVRTTAPVERPEREAALLEHSARPRLVSQLKSPIVRGWTPSSLGHAVDKCYRCQRAGHVSRDCPYMACKHCKKCGHFESDCPRRVQKK